MIFGITLATITAGFLCIISLWVTRAFFKSAGFFNPFVLFFGIWFFDLFLYELDSYYGLFCLSMTDKADFWMTIGFISFFLGGITAAFLAKKSNVNFMQNQMQFDVLWKISRYLFIFFAVAVIWKYFILIKRYGNPFLILGRIREDSFEGQFVYPTFLYFFILPAYLLIINLGVLTKVRPSKSVIILSVATLFFAFLNSASVGSRSECMFFLLLYLTSMTLTNIMLGKPIVIRRFLMIILSMVLFVFILAIILYLRNDGTLTVADALIKHSYIYLVGTIPAYSYFIDYPWPSSLVGTYSFAGMYLLINELFKPFDSSIIPYVDPHVFYAPVNHIGPFNSTGFLTYFHSDFGDLGIIMGPYILGFIVTYCFLKMLISKRLIDVQLVAVLLLTTIYTIRVIMTSGVFFWVTIALIFLQYSYISKRVSRLV